MTPHIFIISLPGSSDRRRSISAQFASHNLKFSWLDGVDGRALDDTTVTQVYDSERTEREIGRQLNRGEVGCALSHQKIYQIMLDQKLDLALVIEDDAALSCDFGAELERVCATVDWNIHDLVLLSHIQKYTDWGAQRISRRMRLIRPLTAYNGNGYLVTATGALKLLSYLKPLHQPADCWNHLMKTTNLRIRGVVPYLISHSKLAQDSVIGEVPFRIGSTIKKNSLSKVLKNIFYYRFLYQLFVKPLLRIRKQPTPW